MANPNRSPDPRNATIRALLARSGNQCAFPGCTHPIVNEKQQFIAQVCHIEAAAPGGPRYHPTMSDEERGGYDNLLLLCHRHHVETDDVSEFTAEALRAVKRAHEAQFAEGSYLPTSAAVEAVRAEADAYWREVARRNREEHVVENLRVEIEEDLDALTIYARQRNLLADLARLRGYLVESDRKLAADVEAKLRDLGYSLEAWRGVPYWENPTVNRNWEVLTLGLNNVPTLMAVLIDQAEIRHLELAIALEPTNAALRSRLEQLRTEVLEYSTKVGYVD